MSLPNNVALLNVWPATAPGEVSNEPGTIQHHDSWGKWLTDITQPQLFVYSHGSSDPRPTVLILPGGGYEIVAGEHEGTEIAEWLYTQGYTTAVLHYRIPHKKDAALADAQRALSLLRAKSFEFGVDSTRLGLLGFSAGGHLTIRTAVAAGKRTYELIDLVDEFECSPDFALAIYPAYLIDRKTSGPSSDVIPHSEMPPVFLMQTRDDEYFCSEQYASFLEQSGVAVESVVYDLGGHGYGIRVGEAVPVPAWQREVEKWLRQI